MNKLLLLVALMIGSFCQANAQTVVINTGTAGTPQYNAGPIYRSSASSNYDASRYTYLYTASELAAVGITSGAIITEVGWVKNNNATSTGGGIFRIFMKNSTASLFSAATETWANLNAGATMTYENLSFTVPATVTPNYITFPFTTNFVYTGGSIEISTEWDINQVAGNPSTGTFDWLWSTVSDHIYGTGQTSLANAGTLSSTSNSISTIDDRRPFIQITFTPGTPCTSPPTAGTATTTATGTICPGSPFTLNLTGNSTGAGQTYTWESSANIAGPYASISSSSPSSSLTINATTTLYYRAAVTCGASTITSTPVLVTVSTGFPGGTYTINAGAATGGTNFHSFTDAAAAISCGIAGPVVFNVVAGSGPYTEQMILPAIGGTSATNTITFNGNGNTITFSSANTDERATIKLNGTDYVTINNLIIDASAGTYGFGVQLLNDADNNTINGCTITSNTSSTSTTNYAGILINSLGTAITTTGNSLCDNNIITGNTVTGGYAGIALVGSGSSSTVDNNQVKNNTIKDFYLYGVYLNGGNNTLIEANDLSRPTRTTVGNFDGVYLTGVSTNTLISKNKLHNPFDGNAASTSASYAFYLTACDATVGNENIISNNIVYNMIGGTGVQNGFLNASSDNVKAVYNTFLLDDATVTTTATVGTRGFYVQGAATGLDYRNNIVSIGRGSLGEKQGIFIDNLTSTYTLSNNDYHMFSATGLVEIGHLGPATGGTGYTTLAGWQTATTQETGSVTIDPVFTSAATGNLTPTAVALNNLGTPITGITTDILNATRNATTPDIGAFEFLSAPVCNAPTGLAAAGITYTGANLSWNAVTGATGYEYAVTTSATPPASGTGQTATTYGASGLTAGTTYYLHVRTECSGSNFSSWTTFSFTTTTCGAPTGLATSNLTSNSATIDWTAITGIVGFEYALNTSSTPPAAGTTTVNNTFNAINLLPATNYCVHVRTVCAAGVYSAWSTFCFNTLAAPVCNAPTVPVISNITATTADVSWGTVAGAAGYEYEVSTNSTPPASGTATSNTTYSAPALTGNTQYYAHVRTDCGSVGFSSWVTTPFSTADTCLAPTATISNITNVSADVNWTAMNGALSYEYEVGTNATPPANGTNTTATFYGASSLTKNTQYYVHLRTICTNDTSSWATVTFTTTNTSVSSIGKGGAGMEVYPNPASNNLTIKITGLSHVQASVTITDVTGKTVKTVTLNKDKTEVDISTMARGVYLLKYADDAGNSSTVRVVKE